ncbi:MAG: hypothetical protein JSW34_04470 [Candidatus Zixiibacteriota bacterium]|nr:MAG: hypothetical protein JSW34_04470 [candidate division Zixibacteria bacterium]
MTLSLSNDWASSVLANNISLSFLNMCSSLEKLSSGYRINSAADGPADLVISEQLRTQIASLNQEIENTSALIYKYETASSNLMDLRSQLTELRTLAIGAANEGFNNEEAQEAYQTAADAIVERYNDVIAESEYNGAVLFDGGEGSLGTLAALEGIDLSSAEAAEASIATIDEAIAEVDALQVDIGSTQRYELESELASLRITSQNLVAAESSLRDTDFVTEFTNFLVEQIKFKAGLALFSHFGLTSSSVLGLFSSS